MILFERCQDCGEQFQPPHHKCKEFVVKCKATDPARKDPNSEIVSFSYKAGSHEDAALKWGMENIGFIMKAFLERYKPRGVELLVPFRVIVVGPDDTAFYVVISGALAFNNTVEIHLQSEIEGPYYE